jgi:hypothetical protein
MVSLEQSPFWGLASYFLPDIIAASTALPNKTTWVHCHIPIPILFYYFPFENYWSQNPDNNLESRYICIKYQGI